MKSDYYKNTNYFYTVVQKSKSEMTDAERNRMQAEIKELQKTVSVSEENSGTLKF